MRLIDGDALKMYMRNALETTRQYYNDGGKWAETITEEFCKDIDEQPTIEPERKTGKWIWQIFSRYMCSDCGRMTNVDECMEKPMYIYCPYCGAKMEEGEQE